MFAADVREPHDAASFHLLVCGMVATRALKGDSPGCVMLIAQKPLQACVLDDILLKSNRGH